MEKKRLRFLIIFALTVRVTNARSRGVSISSLLGQQDLNETSKFLRRLSSSERTKRTRVQIYSQIDRSKSQRRNPSFLLRVKNALIIVVIGHRAVDDNDILSRPPTASSDLGATVSLSSYRANIISRWIIIMGGKSVGLFYGRSVNSVHGWMDRASSLDRRS